MFEIHEVVEGSNRNKAIFKPYEHKNSLRRFNN
jgi:hypothetical protein